MCAFMTVRGEERDNA